MFVKNLDKNKIADRKFKNENSKSNKIDNKMY